MGAKDSVIIAVGKNIFCGKIVGMEDNKTRILFKQSEKSNIIMSILIDKLSYILNMDGHKIVQKEDMENYIQRSLER